MNFWNSEAAYLFIRFIEQVGYAQFLDYLQLSERFLNSLIDMGTGSLLDYEMIRILGP